MANFSDDFNTLAADALLNTRSGWADHPSHTTANLIGTTTPTGAIRTNANGSSAIAYATADPGSADHSAQADLVFPASIANSGDSHGVVVRLSTTADTFYLAQWQKDTATVAVYKCVAGAFTAISGPGGAVTVANGSTHTLYLGVSGTTLTVKWDGVQLGTTATDSTIAGTGSRAGISSFASNPGSQADGQAIRFDNFAMVGAASGPTSYTLTAPSPATGQPGVASGNFTLTLNAAATGTVTFTPSDGGAGGTFTPSSPQITAGNTSVTFTYTAASAGAKTISTTNGSSLTDPAAVTFTAYTLALAPSSQSVAVGVAASLTATLTPSASGLTASTNGSGTLSTTTPTSGTPFTLTPTTAATETVTVSGPGGTSATATVTGTLSPVVSPSTATIDQGQTQNLTAANFTGGAVTWSSSNPAVASIDSAGNVTGQAHGQATSQTATITATGVSNPSETATATVAVRAVAVSVSPSTEAMSVGGTATLTAGVTGSTNTGVTWSSSNTAVATVNSSGVVTAVANGSATITATSQADTLRSAACAVTVASTSARLLSAEFGSARSGLSTVGYTLLNPDRTTYQARTTTGVGEIGTATGCYGASVTLPTAWTGWVLWDTGGSAPVYAIQTT